MSKLFKSWKTGISAVAVVVAAIIGINIANAEDHTVDPATGTVDGKSGSFTLVNFENYLIDCRDQGGYLTLKFQSDPTGLVTVRPATVGSWVSRADPLEVSEKSDDNLTWKWYLPAGSYYDIWPTADIPNVTLVFELTDDGDTGITWTEIEFTDQDGAMKSQTYSEQPYNLTFTPETDGKLIAAQGGNADPALYTDEVCMTYAPNDGYMGTNPFNYTYLLTAGVQYYFKSTAVTSVTFEWVPTSETYDIVEVDTDYAVNKDSNKMIYEPTEDGTLTVFKKGFYPYFNNFLYTDKDCKDALTLDSYEVSDPDGGTYFKFSVTANTKYYLYWTYTSAAMTFRFSFSNEVATGKIAQVDPLPGTAFDPTDPGAQTFLVRFDPTSVTIKGVTVKYQTADGPKELPLSFGTYGGYDMQGGQFYTVNFPTFINPQGGRNSESESKSIYPTITGEDITYVLEGANLNGVPVTESDVTGDNISVDAEGNITIVYKMKPATTITSQTWPTTFYQSWAKGDETGKAVLVYNNDLDASATMEVKVMSGHYVLGGIYETEFPEQTLPKENITVEGNTLNIDFTGVEWTNTASEVTILLSGVTDVDGMKCRYSDGNSILVKYISAKAEAAPQPEPEEVLYLGTDPENGSEVEILDDNTASFKAMFDGNVKINYAVVKSRSLVMVTLTSQPVDASGEYAKEWNLTFPADGVETMLNAGLEKFTVNFQAQDEQGNYILDKNAVANVENEIVVSFIPSKTVELGEDFDVVVAEEVNHHLAKFDVSKAGYYIQANDYTVSGVNNFTSIKITGDDVNFTANAVSYDDETQTVTFEPAITESGSYTIEFPYQAFTIGIHNGSGSLDGQDHNEGEVIFDSKEKEFTFQVTVNPVVYDTDPGTPDMAHSTELTADDASSANAVNRAQISDVSFNWGEEYEAAINGTDKQVTIKKHNDGSNEKQLVPSVSNGHLVIPVKAYFNGLEQSNENNGVYVINIPAETVVISKKAEGIALLADEAPVYNDEKNVYMNLDVMTGVISILDADADGLYRVYNISGVNVLNTENALDINNLVPGIYIVNGKKVVVK